MDVPGAKTLRPTNVACGFNTGPTAYVGLVSCWSFPSLIPTRCHPGPKPTFSKFQLHLERGFPWKYSPCGDTVTCFFYSSNIINLFTWFLLYRFFFYLSLMLHSRYGNIVRCLISQKSFE